MKKHKRKDLGLPALCALGSLFSLAIITVISFILALASSFTKDPTALTGAFSLLALILSGALSGFITSKVNGDGGGLIGIISSLISTGALLLIGLVWKGGFLPIDAIINALAYLGVSVIFSFLGQKKLKRSRKRRYV